LYVENFGTLQQFSLSLTDGKNTLLRPNGWGKSSLAVFIKAMLYGLPSSTRRSLIENERKRYTPWQGGTFGGSMDVEVASRRLRVERTFGAKESEDTLSLTDLDTGVELPTDANVSLGEAWFGVDAAAYERSTYISQRPTDESDGNLSIHAKLNRLADATDDIAGYDHAMELLEKQRKYYTVSGGRRGAIADDEEALAHLEAQMESCRVQLAAARENEARLDRLHVALQENKKESAALHVREQEQLRQGEMLAKRQALRRMKEQLTLSEAEYTALLQTLGGHLPDEQTLESLALLEQEMSAGLSLAEQLRERCAPGHPQSVELAELMALFGDDAPDDIDIKQLREVAEKAKSAKLQLVSEQAKESAITDTQDAKGTYADFPDARRLQRFLMQYPLQKQQADTRTLELERSYRESAERAFARQIACKKKKTVALIVSVIGLLLSVVTFMAQPIAGAAVLALSVGTVSLLILLRRREVAKCREEQGKRGGIEQQRDEQKKKTAQLQSDLHSACDRIREVLGVQVSDAEAAQGAMEEYEAHRAQVTAQRREREAVRQAWYDRIYALRQSADAEQAFLHQLWAWGDCPDVDDAPVKVERLAQRAARYAQLQEQLAATLKQREALRARLKELQEKKDTLLQGCIDVPTVGVATWLRERREQAQRLQMSCERQRRELSEFAEQNGFPADEIDVTEQLPPAADGAMLQELREALDAQEQELHGQIARCCREIEVQTEAGAPLESLEHEASELRGKIERERAALTTILSAQKYLKEAKEKFSGRYLERMKAGFSRYLSRLCGEEHISVTMDGNFSVKLRRAGVSRTPEAMSTGWRDMIALCARLSLVDALFEAETPFLVLDDPFVNLDDDTAARAAVLLDEAASRYQVLYLTCHSSRS
jgi:uncharacterized protein YhaN